MLVVTVITEQELNILCMYLLTEMSNIEIKVLVYSLTKTFVSQRAARLDGTEKYIGYGVMCLL
jgi:hypothetical protein